MDWQEGVLHISRAKFKSNCLQLFAKNKNVTKQKRTFTELLQTKTEAV